MQRNELIEQDKIEWLIDAIFEGQATVYAAYSKYDSDTSSFSNSIDLKTHIETEINDGKRFIDVAIHYPETKGFVHRQKIDLDPRSCNGAKFRYRTSGWGLIQFQIDFQGNEMAECRFAVNTEKRALGWSTAYPDLKAPALWDWKLVEKNARRLIRVLRKCA